MLNYTVFTLVEGQWNETETLEAKSRRQAMKMLRPLDENKNATPKYPEGNFKVRKVIN